MDSMGEEKAVMIWDNGIETCILSCKKRIASLGSIQDTGCLGLVHREMIWSGRWEGDSGLGACIHPWLIHVNAWQNQYSIVKLNKVKKNCIEKEMATHSSILTWVISWTEEPGGPSPWGCKELDMT